MKKIKDPKFEIDRLEFYSLSLYLGVRDFQILITDNESNYVLLLEDYVFQPGLQDDVQREVVRFIFDDHHLLLANFWKTINLIIKNRNYSFLPYNMFEESNSSRYLGLHTSFNANKDELMLTYHKSLDLVNIFSVPQWVTDLLAEIYPGKTINYIHQSGSLLNGMIDQNSGDQKDVAIYIDRFGMHIVAVENKKLIFYNQYIIRKFTDYTNYIKMVAGELNIDLQNDHIKIYGYLGKNTPHFQELKKHLHELTFGERPVNLKFGYVFDELAEHQYFDLFATEIQRP